MFENHSISIVVLIVIYSENCWRIFGVIFKYFGKIISLFYLQVKNGLTPLMYGSFCFINLANPPCERHICTARRISLIKSVENPTALLTIIEIARDSNFELILYKNKSEVPASIMSICCMVVV